jgi:tetratricopeptide (TPR) repeat protein
MRTSLSTAALAALFVGSGAAAAQVSKSDAVSEENRKEAREHYQAGMERMRAESFEEAAGEFRAAIRLDRLFVPAHYQLGEARMALRQYPEAVEALEQCVAVCKELTTLQETDRALWEKRLDEEIQALKDSLQALARDPSHAAQPENKALRLESQLQDLERRKHKGVRATDVPAEFSLALGSAYLRSGRIPDAEKAYADAVRVNPKMGEAHNNLAVVFFRTGRLDDAEKELKAAEKSGYAVNPRFKDDLKKAKEAAPKP